MDRRGELSNQVAPTILYHYSYLFDEEGIWLFKTLKWKDPVPADFYRFCQLDWVNIAVLATETLENEVERLMKGVPFRRIYTYQDNKDIQRLGAEPWHNFVVYYDSDSVRGCSFGKERWKTE